MAVAVVAYLEQSPAGAQEGCCLAAQDDAALGLAVFGKLQVAFDVVLEKLADVTRVVEVTLAEFLGFLFAEILAQQAAALGKAVAIVAFDVGGKFCQRGLLCSPSRYSYGVRLPLSRFSLASTSTLLFLLSSKLRE